MPHLALLRHFKRTQLQRVGGQHHLRAAPWLFPMWNVDNNSIQFTGLLGDINETL